MRSAMHKKGALNRNAASLPSAHPWAHSHPLHKALARLRLARAALFAKKNDILQRFLCSMWSQLKELRRGWQSTAPTFGSQKELSLHPHPYIATFREQAVAFGRLFETNKQFQNLVLSQHKTPNRTTTGQSPTKKD